MSYDFNTRPAPCPHEIIGERYVVDPIDFKTLHLAADTSLNMRAPINGRSTVTVRISGELVQPSDPVYGYNITPDINRLSTPDQFYKVMLSRPVRWLVPLIEVGYTTLQPYCLRCVSLGSLNDYIESPSGSLSRVTNTAKLVQSCLKFILTSVCPFYPQFTCPIRNYLGMKFGTTVTEEDVASQVMSSLQSLKSIQAAQRTVQTLSPLEMLKDITGVSTSMPDPMSISVACSVTSYGGRATPLPVNFLISSTRELVGGAS
jgi:hypothetical protein